jgi:CPA1 family monovalent cation:H+ antiporter
LFVILLGLATGTQEIWSVKAATIFFLIQVIGGVALGLLMGWLAARLLRTIDNYEVAIILTLGMVAGGYSFAHSIVKVSGPICMAVAGLTVGGLLKNGNMSKETLQKLDAFWELLDEVLNAILFVTIGLEFLSLNFTMDTVLAAIGAIIITIAARWISVMIPVASVSMLFRKFSQNVVLIMTWGGLRGGISIALALTLPYGAERDFVVAITYSVVLFSIMVQGLTLGSLVRKLTGRPEIKEKPRTEEEDNNELPVEDLEDIV